MLKQRRVSWRAWLTLLCITAIVCAFAIPHHPWYREWRFSHLSLPQLQRQVMEFSGDPIYLYYLGRGLNDKQRFAEADPVLRHAVGLYPESARLRDEWARALLGSGLTTAAFGELRQYVGANPNSASAHFMLGKFYLSEKAMDRARDELQRSVAIDSSNGEAWAYLAASEDEMGDTRRAMEALQKAADIRPNDGGIHLSHAMLLARNNSPAARQEYARAASLLPRSAVAHREYANWLLSSSDAGDLRLAEAEARRAVALDPKDNASQLVLGEVLAQSGQVKLALAPLLAAARLAPDDPLPARALTNAYHTLGQSAQAAQWQADYLKRQRYFSEVNDLTARTRVDPSPALERQLARLLGLHGDVAGCVRHFAEAERCAPDAPPALTAAADTLAEGGYAADAVPLARRAAALSKASPAAHEALGNALLGTGQLAAALAEYKQVVGWQPDHAVAIQRRIEQYREQQALHPAPAEAAFREAARLQSTTVGPVTATNQIEGLAKRAVSLEPANPRYLEYLLSVQMERRENDAAVGTARLLITAAPHDARGHAMLAVLLCSSAQTPRELAAIEAHLKEAAGDPAVAATWHYGRGLLALLRHQPAMAITELRQTIKLDPRAEPAYFKLAQAEGLAGHTAESSRLMAEFNSRYNAKSQEWKALQDIHQHPNQKGLYEEAAKLFEAHGLPAQGSAIRAAAQKRFGGQAASSPSRRHT